ncbi:uncharacterized protein LOC141899213 [Tubulanus polymorphus]|uniref:uncharacterized protein LOC141899213 n=1 Tax=Tubulanus polymorphus TaxID=672921 RepID=UPI003DA60ECD
MSGVGLNLRVSYKLCQGGRKYMEDVYSVHFVESADGDTELVFIGVFDGHGGREAAEFAKKHLVQQIINQDIFWSSDDKQVLEAIKIGFVRTHELMWKEVDKWPKNGSGKRSTAGTTCSIGIIRNSKLYVGHVGDSAIVLGMQDEGSKPFKAWQLTTDHKPESPEEKTRIEAMGGKVVEGKTGVQRVVWNRPIAGHKGPVRRSTQLEEVPFLAVARSLGDLWSYNFANGEFAVSPVPDVSVHHLDPAIHKCLVFGSDGLWNVMSPFEAVTIVQNVEEKIEDRILNDPTVGVNYWINPSARIVDTAILRWQSRNLRADNTTAVVVLLDPYGPRRSECLFAQRMINMKLLREKGKRVADGVLDSKRKTSAPAIASTVKFKASEQPGVSCTVKRDIPSTLNTPILDGNANNNSVPSPSKPASLTRQSCVHPKLSPKSSPEIVNSAIVADGGNISASAACADTSNNVDCGRSLRASNGSKSNLSLNSKVIHNQIKSADSPSSVNKSCQSRSRTTDEPENDDQVTGISDAAGNLRRKSERLNTATKRVRATRTNSHKNKLSTPISTARNGGHMRLRPRSAEKNENQNSSPARTRTRSSNPGVNRQFTALKRKHGDEPTETRRKRTRVV